MRIQLLLLFKFIMICLFFNCNPPSPEVDTPPEPGGERNMFGLHLPRGLIKNTEGLAPGYILFAVPNSAFFYLINRQGQVVHQWKGNYGVLGGYLMDDGALVQNAADPDFPVFAGGGESGRLQRISWDSRMIWDFEYADETRHAHHDFAVMPNGNVLAMVWEAKSAEEALQAGRKPDLIPKAGLWPDMIVEIQPQGKYGGKIVWEWHLWDHMIQDFDPDRDNYGDPAAHPELLDINLGEHLPEPITQDSLDKMHASGRAWRNQTLENRGSDLYHSNALDYNPTLDQIAISCRQLSEIFIIDHSTTTEEAAGHSGGRWGKGGDILYRWGNPQNYRQGDSTDQQLFVQHDVRWIEDGFPGAGHLTIFNNDIPGPGGKNYSAVYEIAPSVDPDGHYVLQDNDRFGPKEPSWKYMARDTFSFWGSFISGAHRMKNGNTFITEGPKGRFFEVTRDGDILWEYLNPYRGQIRRPNGDPINPIPLAYIQFRSTFIPADHPALAGKALKPLEPQPAVFKLPVSPGTGPEL